MIEPFPEEWELISLFECEPKRKDLSIPWAYDRLTYSAVRGQDSIHCELEINGFLELSWHREGIEQARIQTTLVRSLQVDSGRGVEKLIAYLDGGPGLLIRAEFQLKPAIRFYVVALPSPEG